MSRIQFDNPSEIERFHAKESWVPVVLGGIPVAAACALVCIGVAFWSPDLLPWSVLASVLITLLSRLPHIIDNWRTDVVVTDRRLYYRRGLINIRDHVCDLTSITDISVDPNFFGRIFRYADVIIQTQAGDDDFMLKEIKDAYRMRQVINQGRDALGAPALPAKPEQRRIRRR